MPPPLHVILNPASCSGKAARKARVVETILRERGAPFRLRITEGPGHAADLARAAADQGAPALVVVGGDGTVHEVANGLLGRPAHPDGPAPGDLPSLAVVPVGTGNDFFRMVGAPRDPRAALALLDEGRRALFDVGTARWEGGARYFVNLLGLGVDVEVIRRREGFRRLPGLAQYLMALGVAILRFDPIPIRIRLDDGEVIEGPTHLSAVTVGPSAGGGFLLNPGAAPDDGALDLCFVEALSHLEVVRHVPRVIRGTHRELDVVRLRRFQEARIEGVGGVPLDFELDGEVLDARPRWIEVGIEPGRLPVLVAEVGP